MVVVTTMMMTIFMPSKGFRGFRVPSNWKEGLQALEVKKVTIFEALGSKTIFILGPIVKSIYFQGSRENINRALGLHHPTPPQLGGLYMVYCDDDDNGFTLI